MFGEALPTDAWQNALNAIQKADVVIVIGTSLKVYPANQLPSMTRGQTVFINMKQSDSDHVFDLAIYGKAGEVLRELNDTMDRIIRENEGEWNFGYYWQTEALRMIKQNKDRDE